MSWKGGEEVCINVWSGIRNLIPMEERPKALSIIIKVLERQDWDGPGWEMRREKWPELSEALKLSGYQEE